MRDAAAAVCFGVAAWVFAAGSAAAADGLKVVVFPMEGAQSPQTPELRDRLEAETVRLRKLVAERGFTLVDTMPQAKKIADSSPLGDCNGCDQDIAKALGADLEVATSVQQISAAVYNLGGTVKDVRSNRVLRQGVIDVQGDSPETWDHAVKFLVKERLFDPPLPKTADELAATVQAAGKGRD